MQQQEMQDLQSEFEFDRMDYLDTIRKQEQVSGTWVSSYEARIQSKCATPRKGCNLAPRLNR